MRAFLVCTAILVLIGRARVADAQLQDLGHRLPAGAGVDAGTQAAQGLYVADRVVWFASNDVHDRDGEEVPLAGFDLDTFANVIGIAGTLKLGPVYASAAIAVPVVDLSISIDDPRASVDRLGLGDIYFEPLKLGSRSTHLDVVASYSLYAPTDENATTGIGRPQWSHQLAAGGTVFFDDHRGWRLSALASYLTNGKKRGIDITRGDTLLIQGGFAVPVQPWLDAGVAGYALWQLTDDRGADLPDVLRGARERAFGLGPEIGVTIEALRSRVTARVTWDIDGKTRPVGTIVIVGIAYLVM
ncbi:MAG: transporter [Kofleriaceae bacterium]|nr:transporter [Kofleriaceae bacterium]